MITRELRADEYDRLKEIHDGFTPDPGNSVAIVAEDGSGVIGRVFLLAPTHLEGPWVKEALRGGRIGFRLVKQAEKSAKDRGITKLFAYAVNAEIEGYLTRLGYKKSPMTVFEKEL